MTEVKCGIRKNEKFLDGIWDLSATRREAEIAKILARDTVLGQEIACGQALQGALAGGRGREKEGELATTSLELKSRCEMLIGGDDISDDIITRGKCFSMFVYIRARFCVALIGGNLSDSSVDGEQQGNWKWNSNYRDLVESSPSFARPTAGAPRRACPLASQENANGFRDRGDKTLGCGIVVQNNRAARSRPV